jgi:hypothetical protein
MWIFPKSIISVSAQAMEASTSDFDARWATECEQLLMRRSKRSRSSAYLREWKMGNLMRLRYGLICDHSLGQSLLAEYLSSVEVIPVSRFQPQEEGKDLTIQGTSGHLFEMELPLFSQPCASLKTSKDTSVLASERSLEIWNQWVTRCRGEYSQRLKQAHLTNASECLSWPSPIASEVRQGFQDRARGMKGSQESLTTVVIKLGLPSPEKPNTDGNRPEFWLTPRAQEPTGDSNFVNRNADRGEHCHPSLTSQAKAWATPQSRDAKGAEGRMIREGQSTDLPSQTEVAPTGQWNRANGKLNPRWVETLMGLPVGWVMPSCAAPVTIAPMNCDC